MFVKFAPALTNYVLAKCASTVWRLLFVATNAAFVSNLNAESIINTWNFPAKTFSLMKVEVCLLYIVFFVPFQEGDLQFYMYQKCLNKNIPYCRHSSNIKYRNRREMQNLYPLHINTWLLTFRAWWRRARCCVFNEF